jgi:hypothetical protein
MIKKGVRRRAVAIGSAVAASLLLALATSSAASADAMRTFNLTIRCDTGEAYALQVNNGSGWYYPDGSSTEAGGIKYFSVFIPASATFLWVMPGSCAGQPFGSGPTALYVPSNITAGTNSISASTVCHDYNYYGYLVYSCPLTSITYGS